MSTITGPAKMSRGRKVAIAALCVGVAVAGTLVYFLVRGEQAAPHGFPGDHHVIVYLDRDVEDDVLEQIESALQEHPLTEQIEYESQEEALERFQDTFSEQPDLVDLTDAADLPSAFRIRLTDSDRSEEFVQEFEEVEGVYEITDLMEAYRYYEPACIEFEDKGISPAEGDTESVLYEIEQACSNFGYDF
ncbi:permease-like cell division protein FtsX [Glycomyces luteolus]|uniref:Permease-like cell division protein FtsX n=1 Tax=Glycomyces luteolus TaxID=2670330 RepID=A0A9X3P978_9ACTN|nr:permease-like cell division protein FtsX [Glycomyces luteolus]MDA1361131.1 permease-like cell division protein FtsX [Glycomyces luteolus]